MGSLGRVCQHCLHSVCSFSPQRWDYMAVRVQCQADLAVAECFHDDSWVDALDEQQ